MVKAAGLMIVAAGLMIVTAGLVSACSPVYLSRTGGGSPLARFPSPPAHHPAATGGDAVELAAVLATLVWPFAADRSAILSSAYGVRAHRGGPEQFHSGLDLRAPSGTPVYAAGNGRVARSAWSGTYGNVVILEHAAGLRSLYGHNRENLVREGDQVRRGQVIALVGRTGNATGDHLHFELRWKGGTVDPRLVLPPLTDGAGR